MFSFFSKISWFEENWSYESNIIHTTHWRERFPTLAENKKKVTWDKRGGDKGKVRKASDAWLSAKRLWILLNSLNSCKKNELRWIYHQTPSPFGWDPKGHRLYVKFDLYIEYSKKWMIGWENVSLFADLREIAIEITSFRVFVGRRERISERLFFSSRKSKKQKELRKTFDRLAAKRSSSSTSNPFFCKLSFHNKLQLWNLFK